MDNLTSGEDLSRMIEKLMADEKFAEIVSAVKGSFSTDADNTGSSNTARDAAVEEDVKSTPASSIPELSPELLSRLPQIMSMLSSGSKEGGSSKDSSHLADRKRLLQALRPFLSEHRREAVDSIVNIAGIADLFGI